MLVVFGRHDEANNVHIIYKQRQNIQPLAGTRFSAQDLGYTPSMSKAGSSSFSVFCCCLVVRYAFHPIPAPHA